MDGLLVLPFGKTPHKKHEAIADHADDDKRCCVVACQQSAGQNNENARAQNIAEQIEIDHCAHRLSVLAGLWFKPGKELCVTRKWVGDCCLESQAAYC